MTPQEGPSPLTGVHLVALDLDGTLLPSDKQLTRRAVRVIAEVREAGIDVTLATGKGWNLTRGYALQLELDAPIVSLEGAYVAHATAAGANTVAAHTVGRATRSDIHDHVHDLELGFFYTHTGQRTRLCHRLENRAHQIAVWDPHLDIVDEPLHAHPEDPFVVHLVGEPERVAEAHTRVLAADLAGTHLWHAPFWDGYHQLQIRAQGVSKQAGVAEALQHLDLTASDLLAAGDWMNDVEMLRMARVGVSFAHSPAPVLEAADIVLNGNSDQDAIIVFLEDALARL